MTGKEKTGSPPKDTWEEVVHGVVGKFKVSYALNKNVVFNPVGAKALAEMLTTMAMRLDKEEWIRERLCTCSDEEFETYIAALRHNRKKRLDNLS